MANEEQIPTTFSIYDDSVEVNEKFGGTACESKVVANNLTNGVDLFVIPDASYCGDCSVQKYCKVKILGGDSKV